nr:hypothetical protein BaRGS_003924 [Batillaria attramentaria]
MIMNMMMTRPRTSVTEEAGGWVGVDEDAEAYTVETVPDLSQPANIVASINIPDAKGVEAMLPHRTQASGSNGNGTTHTITYKGTLVTTAMTPSSTQSEMPNPGQPNLAHLFSPLSPIFSALMGNSSASLQQQLQQQQQQHQQQVSTSGDFPHHASCDFTVPAVTVSDSGAAFTSTSPSPASVQSPVSQMSQQDHDTYSQGFGSPLTPCSAHSPEPQMGSMQESGVKGEDSLGSYSSPPPPPPYSQSLQMPVSMDIGMGSMKQPPTYTSCAQQQAQQQEPGNFLNLPPCSLPETILQMQISELGPSKQTLNADLRWTIAPSQLTAQLPDFSALQVGAPPVPHRQHHQD